jgi:hypothetical protein
MKKTEKLRESFKKNILTSQQVIEESVRKKASHGNPVQIKRNFSGLVREIEDEAYHVYLEAQEKAWKKTIRQYCDSEVGTNANYDAFLLFLQEHLADFDCLFLSIAQSRKSRAGKAFESIIRTLFRELNYPFSEQQVINGKPDFLMPSRSHYDAHPMDCIVFTAKRTLRERWRQIVTEGMKARGFFLATIDNKISENGLKEMNANKIFLVVPQSLKHEIPHYQKAPNVISFEDFFEDYLDPAMKRWKKAGAI